MKTPSLSGAFAGMFLLIGNVPPDVLLPPNAHDVGTVYSAPIVAEATANRALAWLADQPGSQPVFVWLHLQDPHGPYAPPVGWSGEIQRVPLAMKGELGVLPHHAALMTMLKPGELLELVRPLEVVRQREGEFEDRCVASVVARKLDLSINE